MLFRRQSGDCRRCGLSAYRKHIVRGRGTIPADILMIGEAPGETEDLTGEAFAGLAGRLLDEMCKKSKLDRFTIYRTNCVLCRPCDGIQEPNREPSPDEVLMCAPNVSGIIRDVRPRAVVLLGDVAERYFRPVYRRAYKLYHPSYLLRTGGHASPAFLGQVREMERIGREIENAV